MKPILVIYLNRPTELQRKAQTETLSRVPGLQDDYHVLVIHSDHTDVQVFFEKDQIALDKEELKKLLSLCE